MPEITIRSESMSEENISDLKEVMRSKADELVGQHMIKSLISEAESQLRVLGLKPGKVVKTTSHRNSSNHQKKKKQKVKLMPQDETQDKKLPSMKTADDVVKRIIWDESLSKDDFTVGYFDRFRGLVEKLFSAFSWEDLASVDYDVLAIPKHRIQYFKYKNFKVWDKLRRIDNVFGSADGTKTIDVVIKEVQEMESHRGTAEDSTVQNVERYDKSEEDSSNESSDSDDGVEVTIGNIAMAYTSSNASSEVSVKETQSRFEYRGGTRSCVKGEKKTLFNSVTYGDDKLRPNHFICVRITNEEILDKIGNIQDELMEQEPILTQCCIPGATLHVTLCTLGLDTPEQLSECMNTLEKIKPLLESALPVSNLRLCGVSSFYNQVIYAKIEYEQDFLEFCNLLKQSLQAAGVEIRDGYDFVPHMTIIKVSRPVARLRGSRNIESDLYMKHSGAYFGGQKIDSIYLCSMGKERRGDGFYLTPLELHF